MITAERAFNITAGLVLMLLATQLIVTMHIDTIYGPYAIGAFIAIMIFMLWILGWYLLWDGSNEAILE